MQKYFTSDICRTALILSLPVFLAACASKGPAPVLDRKPSVEIAAKPVETPTIAVKPFEEVVKTHVVQKGETLYSLALLYGLDYRELAAWNNIENLGLIRVGLELRVSPPAMPAPPSGVVATPLVSAPPPVPELPAANTLTMKVEPKAVKAPYSDKTLAQMEAEARASQATQGTQVAAAPTPAMAPAAAPPAKVENDLIDWGWPVRGKMLGGYTETSKGLDIAGALGTPVTAAADGKVVYSGTALRGYGKLVIIKHNSTYLSAYAHNSHIVVNEGQDVKKGQKIAEMGSSDTDQVKLHFEVRKQGKPVDPARYLPPA
jgi:lipoprotein NlpD